jgi:hypothetical protein
MQAGTREGTLVIYAERALLVELEEEVAAVIRVQVELGASLQAERENG